MPIILPTYEARAASGSDHAEAILAAVVFGAQKFLHQADWTGSLEQWLEQLGAATGVAQVRIFANQEAASDDMLRSTVRAQWNAAGSDTARSKTIDNVSLRAAGCGRWQDMLARGEPVVGNIDELPACERPLLEAAGYTSVAIVPVFASDRWWGFIGLADNHGKRTWHGAELNALTAAAGIYGAAITRREMEERIAAAVAQEQLATEIGAVLTAGARSLDEQLHLCSLRVAHHVRAELVRVWALDRDGNLLRAAATSFDHLTLPISEVRIGECAVGAIAETRRVQVWRAGLPELWPGSIALTQEAGWSAGAGYPLIIEDQVVGVVVMLTGSEPASAALDGLASITDELALAIERSRSLSAMDLREDRYKRLVEAAVEGVCIHDGRRILDANPGIAAMVGYTIDEIIGTSPLDYIHPDDRPTAIRNITINYTDAYEVNFVRKDGSVFPVEVKGRDFIYDGEKLRVTTVRDMTERKRAERTAQQLLEERHAREAAERSRVQADFLADASRILSSSFDTTTTLNQLAHLSVRFLADFCVVSVFRDNAMEHVAIVHADPAMNELLAQAVSMWNRYWHEDHELTLQQKQGKAFIVPALTVADLDAMAADDEHRAVLNRLGMTSLMSVPICSGGDLIGTIMFSAGLSRSAFSPEDLAIAQELGRRAALALESAHSYHQARAATLARDEMLAVVAHDLRNPLNTIHMGSKLALDMLVDRPGDVVRKQFEIIARTTEHMNRLIQDLLDATRLQSGQLALDIVPTRPASIINEAMEILQPLAIHACIDLQADVADGLPLLSVDRARVLQLLSNLVGNALKFTPRGGSVVLSVMEGDGAVCFGVSDTGPGIATDQLPHIFGRFWQARRTDRRGLGLGLAIAKGIVEAHGGTILVKSREGVGTSFMFTVPL